MTVHTAVPPEWICAGCNMYWPCQTRRKQLLAEFDGQRRPLADYMSTMFVAAASDLRYTRTGDLYEQFLGWVRGATK